MVKVILEGFIEIPEMELPQVLDALPEHRELTLCEPGCLLFNVEPDERQPYRYNVYEEFINRKAFEYHQERVKGSKWGKVTINVKRHYRVYELS